MSFYDGGQGTYDPEGNLLTVQMGNPPGTVWGQRLLNNALGGSSALPSRAGAPVSVPLGGGLRFAR
ncbi:MAG: hypothetical protein LH603_17620 [Pseudonocardia sp.]|nr:hypothetical protein [Pseudonocardia sp.]